MFCLVFIVLLSVVVCVWLVWYMVSVLLMLCSVMSIVCW